MDSSHSSLFDSMFPNPKTEYENKNRSKITLNDNKTLNEKMSPIKNTKVSNLSYQTSNNSLKYFNNLRRNNIFQDANNTDQFKNNYATPSYQVKSLNTKSVLHESKKVFTNEKKKQLLNSDPIDLSKKLASTLKSSPDYEYSGKKSLKRVKKNKEISIAPDDNKQRPNESNSSLTINKPLTVNSSDNNNKCTIYEQFDSSMSLDAYHHLNVDMELIKQKTNLELLKDISVSDLSIVSKDSYDSSSSALSSLINRSYQSYLSADVESVPSQIELTPPQLCLQTNVSLRGDGDDLILQKQSNVISNLIHDYNGNQQSQTNGKQNCSLNQEHSKTNQSNLFSEELSSINSISGPELNVCTSIGSVSPEPHYSGCKRRRSSSLKNDGKDTIHTISKKKIKKQNESIDSPFRAFMTNITNDLVKKNVFDRKKTNRSRSKIDNDIGLQYDADNDMYNMLELPNGATIPSFLSTSNDAKKICACGITMEETPKYWSESLHNILHQNIYKLFFIGKLPVNDVVKFKQDNLSYKIIMLSVNHYSDKNIQKCIKNINDFICLEYGIPKSNTNSLRNSIYLAVLPGLKVIGYLEVEPIKNAHILNHKEQLSKIVPVKFGVPKIWISIKYTDKNVDINLLETFRKNENLQKEDLAFNLNGRQVVKCIKKYIGQGNILIYNK